MTTKLPGNISQLFNSMFTPCKRKSNIVNVKIRKQGAKPVVTENALPTLSATERMLAELIGKLRADIIELNIRCDSLERQLIKLRESYELERGE